MISLTESEMNEIIKEIRSGTNIVLFSPGRMGKSSRSAAESMIISFSSCPSNLRT